MDQYAVFGNPIGHSRSPWIHARFARQTNQSLAYRAEEIPLNAFEDRVQAFFAAGGAGLNITVPFKERAWAMCDLRSDAASAAGAVNTLFTNATGQLCGENTDGVGMMRDIICNHGGTVAGKTVLLVGAGGAVRGVMPSLLAEGPASVMIVNRTVTRAQELATLFHTSIPVAATGYENLTDKSFDLIINGTSAGLQGELPPLPDSIVGADTWCYDMVYGRGDTAFQRWAKGLGATAALNGIGMLVEQAAEAFSIWRGVKPDTTDAIAELQRELGSAI